VNFIVMVVFTLECVVVCSNKDVGFWSWGLNPVRDEIFHFVTSTSMLGFTRRPILWVLGFFLGGKAA
jgi:hypothetical protein